MDEKIPMHYRIVRERPGRLRVRFGRAAFAAEEGYGIAEQVCAVPGVREVTTTPANGGVLVCYDPDVPAARDGALAALGALVRGQLPVAQGSDEQRRAEVDAHYLGALAKKVGFWAGRRAFLPSPVRVAWTLVRSTGFIMKGLRALAAGQMKVEVLDATAIVASMLQGNFNSAGIVMLLLDVSDLLEEYTHARSRIALEQSLAVTADDVWLVSPDGAEVQVSLSEVRAGDKLRVRTGAMVPVDGTVAAGEAAINEASMTGESKLAVKSAGASVYAGTIVEDGSIVVEVRQTGSDTRIANIVRMVDESQQAKAGVQSRAERLADAIVPYSFLGFFAVLAFTRNVTKAVSVLMVDYSCAIKLSTPVAVMRAMRECAHHGIVVKGGRYLEVMAGADTIVFDKTGTLTTAVPHVTQVLTFADMDADEVLRLAACLEEHFPHSMARAVVEAARASGVAHVDEQHADVEYVVAHGIVSGVDGRRVLLGSAHFVFDDEGVKRPAGFEQRIADEAPGASVVYLACGDELKGAICIDDPVRAEAAATVAALRRAGFTRIVMLTGDAEGAARVAADRLGIDEYRSQVLPEDKASVLDALKREGRTVVMVGDGVNDSPALAAADASVAMVDASDIAREVADITLLHSSLDQLLVLRRISERLVARIGRNYRFIVAFNTALLAGGVAGVLAPTTGALLHNLSTMGVTASNMRPLLGERDVTPAALPESGAAGL